MRRAAIVLVLAAVLAGPASATAAAASAAAASAAASASAPSATPGAATVVGAAPSATSGAAATVVAASTDAAPNSTPPAVCPGHEAPPGPPAVEETVPVAAVAVPDAPVGGPALGTCGDLLPPGAAPPAGITAAGWIVADLDTGAVVAAHDPHGRQRPASTLKILTALVVAANLDPNTDVVAQQEDVDVDGSQAGIGPGGHYTVRQLLTGLLLNSGNDTASALARTLGGTPRTLQLMQDRATELGALDTRPATPSGLDGSGMSTSAYDLALLFRVALRVPLVRDTLTTRIVPFPGFADRPGFLMANDDPLFDAYPGALAGKTGFTDAARHTFVGAAERNGRRLVVALVRGEQQPTRLVTQTAALLDYGFAQPAGTNLGTLVDARPLPPPSTPAPTPAPTPNPTPTAAAPPAGSSWPWIVAIGVALLLATCAVLLARRRT